MKRDGREAFHFFPHNRGSMRRYLYAIGYADGRTKIGLSYSPRARLILHWRKRTSEFMWVHLFNPPTSFATERRALSLASKRAERIDGTEVFRGLTRAAALECGRMALAEAA